MSLLSCFANPGLNMRWRRYGRASSRAYIFPIAMSLASTLTANRNMANTKIRENPIDHARPGKMIRPAHCVTCTGVDPHLPFCWSTVYMVANGSRGAHVRKKSRGGEEPPAARAAASA
jgi:hypothetical protein